MAVSPKAQSLSQGETAGGRRGEGVAWGGGGHSAPLS